jgi:hypothetical protein
MRRTKRNPTKLSELKKGDYFWFPKGKKEYEFTGRSRGKFTYSDLADISTSYETKTDRPIIF